MKRDRVNAGTCTTAVFLVSMLFAVCSSASAAAPSIKILSIKPDVSTSLHVGQRVTLEVEVEFELLADSGTITLVVQKGEQSAGMSEVSIASSTAVVTKGKGTETLRVSFTVPDTRAVEIFLPLRAQGVADTTTVDTRAYGVLPK